MVGLRLSPLRGLFTIRLVSSYNLFIPSGLKKMTQITNHVNTEAMYHFGLEFLFDGYLINTVENCPKLLKTKVYLFDGHLIKHTI
jgi:hypothetical protein